MIFSFGNLSPDSDVVLIYGNCQAPYVGELLAAADAPQSGRHYLCVLNHAVPGAEIELPDKALLARCVLYIEQIDERAEVPIRSFLRDNIPAGVETATYPPVVMMCFWPFETVDKRIGSSRYYPWGRYNGDMIGMQVARQGLTGDAAYGAYMDLAEKRMPNLANRLQWDIDAISARDQAADVQIGDYLATSYRYKHIFWTAGHLEIEPMAVLTCRLYEHLSPRLGGDRAEGLRLLDAFAFELQDRVGGMGNTQLPINPLVAQGLGLHYGGEDMVYRWYDQEWTFKDYITRYIANDEAWGLQE
ncbi:WcbI family polysaccharide biosynthesis putative acetyltransferase [Lacibacterium aquatile]|uniref:WcbI family polysaccharide biosynthesis putative acetyltransferase n=1 Tax=Lacibacterium aquatile TaxID=1168082 RepID=A0ABW5DUZ3_9PROT